MNDLIIVISDRLSAMVIDEDWLTQIYNSLSLWVMNYFSTYKSFLTNKTLQASSCSIAMSMAIFWRATFLSSTSSFPVVFIAFIYMQIPLEKIWINLLPLAMGEIVRLVSEWKSLLFSKNSLCKIHWHTHKKFIFPIQNIFWL